MCNYCSSPATYVLSCLFHQRLNWSCAGANLLMVTRGNSQSLWVHGSYWTIAVHCSHSSQIHSSQREAVSLRRYNFGPEEEEKRNPEPQLLNPSWLECLERKVRAKHLVKPAVSSLEMEIQVPGSDTNHTISSFPDSVGAVHMWHSPTETVSLNFSEEFTRD